MPPPTALAAKAKQCLEKAAPIPGAPLWHMGKASADDKAIMQNAIDYLTCKAKAQMPFTEEEKRFLVELYEAFWWGGKGTNILETLGFNFQGMPEAAELANHYMHGNGKTLAVNPGLYKSSVIVRDTMAAMKEFIRESINKGVPVPVLNSGDPKFMQSTHFTKVSKHAGHRSQETQGHVLSGGVLQAEQKNLRLHYANNRFHLQAFSQAFMAFSRPLFSTSSTRTARMLTRWRVDDTWNYAPLGSDDDNAKHITKIPIGHKREHKLFLPDGLSHYMTVLGIAKEFNYWAEWYEYWDL